MVSPLLAVPGGEEPGSEGWPVLFWLCRVKIITEHGHDGQIVLQAVQMFIDDQKQEPSGPVALRPGPRSSGRGDRECLTSKKAVTAHLVEN